MRDLLFLAHRLPYPPEKGEKIRAWHIFRHLARSYRIHLGCFVDDQADLAHLPALAAQCADLEAIPIDPHRQKLRALLRLRPGRPLTLGYFEDRRLRAWVAAKLAAGIDRAFVYCSAMAPYVIEAAGLRRVLDMVDVDSAKWAEYAARAPWPARMLWAREARTLLAFERRAALACEHTLFVSAAEVQSFAALAPEAAGRCSALENGVDSVGFAPAPGLACPYPPGGGPVVAFTGTMDYRPNVDAVRWFAHDILPLLHRDRPELRFAIVGAHPVSAVRRLATRSGVIVTGRVADIRPYLAHAAVAVAPLRLARGIQNKVLEAMAMARPVVATPQAFSGIDALPGRDLLLAEDAAGFAAAVSAILDGHHPGLGAAARAVVERRYAWSTALAGLDALLAGQDAVSLEAVA
jgi:sugar transferase (PEP-CTERM/EpsH1 system associated)